MRASGFCILPLSSTCQTGFPVYDAHPSGAHVFATLTQTPVDSVLFPNFSCKVLNILLHVQDCEMRFLNNKLGFFRPLSPNQMAFGDIVCFFYCIFFHACFISLVVLMLKLVSFHCPAWQRPLVDQQTLELPECMLSDKKCYLVVCGVIICFQFSLDHNIKQCIYGKPC